MHTMDDDAFAAEFMAHYARLVRLAARVLGERAEAEEAAQDALLALRTDPVAARGAGDIAAWLSRVVTNKALNRLRGRRRAEVRAEVAATTAGHAAPDDPVDLVIADDDRARVRAALATLPDRQATALLLRHAGHSYAEIAVALGVATGSVGVLLGRGERAFRSAYEEMPR